MGPQDRENTHIVTTDTTRQATVADLPAEAFASQRVQYATLGPAGFSHERHTLTGRGPHAIVDCLLWRDADGALGGILNHYPNDIPPLQQAGSFLVLVDPTRLRQGIGTRLLAEADRRWHLDLDAQEYTQAGLALADAYDRHHRARTLGITFAAIVSLARRQAALTAAEMDYSLAVGDGTGRRALANAAWDIANAGRDHPPGDEGNATIGQARARRGERLNAAIQPLVDAMTATAKTHTYVGWSTASTGPIRYG